MQKKLKSPSSFKNKHPILRILILTYSVTSILIIMSHYMAVNMGSVYQVIK